MTESLVKAEQEVSRLSQDLGVKEEEANTLQKGKGPVLIWQQFLLIHLLLVFMMYLNARSLTIYVDS